MAWEYIVMWNLPGCLPEMEPLDFDSLYNAQDMLEAEFQDRIEQAAEIDDETRCNSMDWWQNMLLEVRQLTETALQKCDWSATGPDGYVYSLGLIAKEPDFE